MKIDVQIAMLGTKFISMVGHKELKSILKDIIKKIRLTQNQVTLVDDVDYEYLNQWKWYANWIYNNFRAVRSMRLNGKKKTIRMHTIIAERMGIDAKYIDHKDQTPLNNQRSNLRAASYSFT